MSSITCAGANLSPASFRGVSFWVKSDKAEYGRRIVHHEYPNADDPFNEDLGEKYKKYMVDGYVVGDTATSDKDAMVAACRLRGAAILQLPAEKPISVVCVSLAVDRNKDEQGMFVLKMEFVADPGVGSPINIPVFESLISGVMTAVGAALGAFYSANFGASNALSYVSGNAVQRVQAFANIMTSTIDNIPGSSDSSRMTQAMTDAIGLFQSAAQIVQPDPTSSTPIDVVTAIGDIFYNVAQAAAPADLLVAMQPLASFSVAENQTSGGVAAYGLDTAVVTYEGSVITITNLVPASVTHAYTGSAIAPSETKDAANAAAFNGVVRVYALIAYAQAAAATAFTDRSQAIQTRATLADLFEQQMDRTMDYDLAIALATARDYAIKALSKTIVSIVPVVTVTANISLPSLYWAGRLYNDATRAEELSDRNDVPTPAYMPQRFEALQS